MEDLKCFRPVAVDCGAVQKIRPHAAKKKGYNFITLNTLLQTKIYTYEIDVYGSTPGGFCHVERLEKGTKWGEGL